MAQDTLKFKKAFDEMRRECFKLLEDKDTEWDCTDYACQQYEQKVEQLQAIVEKLNATIRDDKQVMSDLRKTLKTKSKELTKSQLVLYHANVEKEKLAQELNRVLKKLGSVESQLSEYKYNQEEKAKEIAALQQENSKLKEDQDISETVLGVEIMKNETLFNSQCNVVKKLNKIVKDMNKDMNKDNESIVDGADNANMQSDNSTYASGAAHDSNDTILSSKLFNEAKHRARIKKRQSRGLHYYYSKQSQSKRNASQI